MKTKIFISLFVFIISFIGAKTQTSVLSHSSLDPNHYLGWDASVAFPLRIEHKANPSWGIEFWTASTQKMVIKGDGKLGLGTSSPSTQFHQYNGDFLIQSNLSLGEYLPPIGQSFSTPVQGAGIRLMFIEHAGAFRVGGISSNTTYWNAVNIGEYSFAAGVDNLADGDMAVAFGIDNQSTGTSSFSCGSENLVTGESAFSSGDQNEATGTFAVTMGHVNQATNTACIALGDGNIVSGHDAVGIGEINTSSGQASVALGFGNNAVANYSVAIGRFCDSNGLSSFSLGNEIDITGQSSGGIGDNISTTSDYSYGIGRNVTSTTNDNIIMGCNALGSPLNNDKSNSLMIGFNSDEPSLFVEGANGLGTYGDVGIATDDPDARLEVENDASAETSSQTSILVDMQAGSASNTGLLIDIDANSSSITHGVEAIIIDGAVESTAGIFQTNSSSATADNRGGIFTADAGSHATPKNTGIIGEAFGGQVGTGVDGISSGSSPNTLTNTGGHFIATGGAIRNYGVVTDANSATFLNIGTSTSASGTSSECYGLTSKASGTGLANYGVFASASGASVQNWPGYFTGSIFVNGVTYPSDEMLKSDVEPLDAGIEELMLLEPKSYTYRCDDYPQLGLPEGHHCGLVVQEVEEVFPSLIHDVHHPEIYDDEGNLISESIDFKGIDYIELVPILISATKEQQEIISAQDDRISSLENLVEELAIVVESCCAVELDNRSGDIDDIQIQDEIDDRNSLEQNIPNPFDQNTRIEFYLSGASNARVCIYNSSGQLIDCLIDEYRNQGSHSLSWNTSDLASGVYFYSLEVDGFETVRRAVKL